MLSCGENEEKKSLCVGATEHIKPGFCLRVRFVRCYDDRLIEENLFALKRANFVLAPDFLGVPLIPFESEVPGEICFAHIVSVLWIYTNVKTKSGPNAEDERRRLSRSPHRLPSALPDG